MNFSSNLQPFVIEAGGVSAANDAGHQLWVFSPVDLAKFAALVAARCAAIAHDAHPRSSVAQAIEDEFPMP